MSDTAGTNYNLHRSNAAGVPWPGPEDVIDWALANDYASSVGQDTSNSRALQMTLDAEISRMAERCGLCVVDPDTGDPVTDIPPEVFLATVMYAAKTYFRRHSPDGIAGSESANGSIRTGRYDPDAERLISNHVRLGLA